MGQYYIAVNLDKKEYLNPYDFNSGAKLLELSTDAGMMAGIALLLADGNGRGGGDLYRTYSSLYSNNADASVRSGERLDFENSWTDSNGKEQISRTFVSEISGRWAGDRVLFTGDYADEGKFLDGLKMDTDGDSINLYTYAERHFKNISSSVIEALKTDDYIKQYLPS